MLDFSVVNSTTGTSSFRLVGLGKVVVDSFVTSVPTLRLTVVKPKGVFSKLSPVATEAAPAVLSVISEEVGMNDEWLARCSVGVVEKGGDSVELKPVLSFNGYVLL